MKTLVAALFVLFIAIAATADETLYRYEGDVHPLDPSAGWVMGSPCDPPCSEFLEDGHFVRLWSEAGDFASYHLQVAEPPIPPPPTLWVETNLRSNFPLGPIFTGCDAAFSIHYQGFTDTLEITGDSVLTFDRADFVLGLDMSEFHTYRLESVDGQNYWWSVDGDRFAFRFEPDAPNGYHSIQIWGRGGCGSDFIPNQKNEFDFVRYGTIDFGERILVTDPPSGFVSAGALASLDTFTVTFGAANYVYLDEITVTSSGGLSPSVIAVRRREIDEPDTVEIVLDRSPPPGRITRFIFDDGQAVNIIEFADFQIDQGACCLPDANCQMLTDAACAMIPETLFHGAGTICAGSTSVGGGKAVSCPCATTLGATIVSHFVSCLTGPGIGKAARCVCPDADSDNDVDLYDYAAFQPIDSLWRR